MVPARLGDTQVGEEGNALRLGEKRVKLSPIACTKVQGTKRPEFNRGHAAPPQSRDAITKNRCPSPKSRLGNGQGTVRRQVRTYEKAGVVATMTNAARLIRTRRQYESPFPTPRGALL
jgi:hypothetical protein